MQSAKLGKYTVYYENGEEYHTVKREVWGTNTYYIELEKENPTIIDAGAHIGLTTLYFKKMYPESRIIAVEPLPANIALLKKNIYENQLADVEIVEAAVAESTGEKTFYYDATDTKWYSTAGFNQGAWTGDQESERMTVPTIQLSTLIEEYTPDLIKLDIEGAEERVIAAAQTVLAQCPHYLIEFHPIEGRGMDRIIKIFEDRGFTLTVTKDGSVVPWQKARGLALIEAVR